MGYDMPIGAMGLGLSGGQRQLVALARALITRPKILLMDEPTNHMDMETIESLQIGLEKYPGTLIFVSHDRYFVERLATKVIEVGNGGVLVHAWWMRRQVFIWALAKDRL